MIILESNCCSSYFDFLIKHPKEKDWNEFSVMTSEIGSPVCVGFWFSEANVVSNMQVPISRVSPLSSLRIQRNFVRFPIGNLFDGLWGEVGLVGQAKLGWESLVVKKSRWRNKTSGSNRLEISALVEPINHVPEIIVSFNSPGRKHTRFSLSVKMHHPRKEIKGKGRLRERGRSENVLLSLPLKLHWLIVNIYYL